MAKPFFNLAAIIMAMGLAVGGVGSTQAAPYFLPAPAHLRSDVLQAQVDAKVVRRDRFNRDGSALKKRHHHRQGRAARNRGSGAGIYQPKAMPKFAYDADGSFRIHDSNRHWRRDRWDGWDDRHRHKKMRKRPQIYRMNSLNHQELSPGLRGILTAVPD